MHDNKWQMNINSETQLSVSGAHRFVFVAMCCPALRHRRPWPAGSMDALRAGRPLASGYSAALVGLQGDLEYFAKYLRLEHFASNQPCCWCAANKSTIPWTEFRRPGRGEAAWWKTQYDRREAWEATHPNRSIIFKALDLSCNNVVPDWLHAKHIGTDCWVYGSALHFLCHQIMRATDGSVQQRAAKLFASIQLRYEERGRSKKYS